MRACGRVRGSQIGSARSPSSLFQSNQGLAGGLGGGDRADWRELLPMRRGGAWEQKEEFVPFAVDLAGSGEPKSVLRSGAASLTIDQGPAERSGLHP